MRSGAGVLCISVAQLLVGLALLGIYEGYKAYYYGRFLKQMEDSGPGFGEDFNQTLGVGERVFAYESPLDWRSPMGFIFFYAIANNIFSICGLAGVLNAQRELVIAFFGYNAAQMVVSFHYFVDMVADSRIAYGGAPPQLSSFEKATAALLFLNFLLSVGATACAVKAVEEMKQKQREEYSRITVLGDTLQYEPDRA